MDTWKQWHEESTVSVIIIFVDFVFFPLIFWLILLLVFLYINDSSPTSRMKAMAKIFAENNKLKVKEHKFHLQNEFTMSVVFVLMAIVLSTLAVSAAFTQTTDKIAKYYSCENPKFCLMYLLPYFLLGQDGIVVLVFGICIFISLCRLIIYNCRKQKKLTLGSVMILEEFEEIPYGPFDYDDTRMDKTYLKKRNPALKYKIGFKKWRSLELRWWTFCAYSALFPLCCLFNHFHYIVISFVHNLSHSASIAIIYGVVALFLYSLLKELPHLLSSCSWCRVISEGESTGKSDSVNSGENNEIIGGESKGLFWKLQLIKLGVVLLLSLYAGFGISLYFLLPIDKGFDDATNNFVTIYHTTIAFLVLFWPIS